MKFLAEKEAKTVGQLREELEVSKTQMNAWLKRATEEGELKKKKGPVRYVWIPTQSKPKQTTIF